MKAQIITINDYFNYGNKLQNYALIKVLSYYGIEAHTSEIVPSSSAKYGRILGCARNDLASTKHTLKEIVRNGQSGLNKIKNFISFENRYIRKGARLYSGHEESCRNRDLVIIGSDQVWNYNWVSYDDLKLRLGLFAPENRLMTYAASIGIDEIPDGLRPLFRNAWRRIPYISVREDRAAELVREIAEKECRVVLDPTLLLTDKQWSTIFTDFVPEGERFVLTYFLGQPTTFQKMLIQDFAKSNNLGIRMLNNPDDITSSAAGPAEFVELFSRADYVFTDSYHACCFALIYNKPFKVFNRTGFSGKDSMNSRMRTLFRLVGLEDTMKDDAVSLRFDWDRHNKLLEMHRRESGRWLEEAVESIASTVSG